jgi:hypothetical protein
MIKHHLIILACLLLLFASCNSRPAGVTPEATVTIQPSATPTIIKATAWSPSSATITATADVAPDTHPSPAPDGPVVTIPIGIPPALDGTMSPGEWDGAVRELFSDGSELFLMYYEDYLFLGIRANVSGLMLGNIFVNHGDQISILHSSGALVTVIYEKRADGWEQNQALSWRYLDTGYSPPTQAELEAFLQQEGWVASNSRMGVPQEMEYKIAMPDGRLRLVVTLAHPSDSNKRNHWPVNINDDTIESPRGEFPTTMQFSPSTWATIVAQNKTP